MIIPAINPRNDEIIKIRNMKTIRPIMENTIKRPNIHTIPPKIALFKEILASRSCFEFRLGLYDLISLFCYYHYVDSFSI
jgi:hypothetical protein